MKKLLIHLMLASAAVESQSRCQRALAKYGALITEIKGSVGGTTFKGTKQGGSVQNKITKVDAGRGSGKITKADAGRVIQVIGNTVANSTAWKDLTDAQRQTWVTQAPNYPFYNKFGEPYTPSGFQLYMSCNNNLLNIGESVLTDAPLPESIISMPAFEVATIAAVLLQMDCPDTIPAGTVATIYGTVVQSQGRNLQKGRLKALVILDDTTVFPYDLAADYVKIFGTVPASGNAWFRGQLTKVSNGIKGLPYTAQYVWP